MCYVVPDEPVAGRVGREVSGRLIPGSAPCFDRRRDGAGANQALQVIARPILPCARLKQGELFCLEIGDRLFQPAVLVQEALKVLLEVLVVLAPSLSLSYQEKPRGEPPDQVVPFPPQFPQLLSGVIHLSRREDRGSFPMSLLGFAPAAEVASDDLLHDLVRRLSLYLGHSVQGVP